MRFLVAHVTPKQGCCISNNTKETHQKKHSSPLGPSDRKPSSTFLPHPPTCSNLPWPPRFCWNMDIAIMAEAVFSHLCPVQDLEQCQIDYSDYRYQDHPVWVSKTTTLHHLGSPLSTHWMVPVNCYTVFGVYPIPWAQWMMGPFSKIVILVYQLFLAII